MKKDRNDITENKESSSIKDYLAIGEIFTYFFRKKDPNHKPDIGLRMMHRVNKFSIIVFLLGVIYFIVTRVFLSS